MNFVEGRALTFVRVICSTLCDSTRTENIAGIRENRYLSGNGTQHFLEDGSP
jgi:hypothetical protein